MKIRKNLFAVAATILSAGTSLAAYPEKPIKLVVPFAPGGPTDVVARSLAEALGRTLGKPVIVENKPGAGGATGSTQVARATPDGYTLGVAAVSTHVVNPACNSTIAYDPVKDFTPIALVAEMPMIWVMQAGMKEKSFAEILTTARSPTGHLTQGTAGMCTLQHMMVEKINDRMKVKIESVPYQGSSPALNGFLGKNIDMLMDVGYLIQPIIASGKAKPIAVISSRRIESLPEVPTVEELGYKDLNIRPWYGVVGPSALPADVTKTLIAAIKTATSDNKLRETFKNSGMMLINDVDGKSFSEKIQREFLENKEFASKTNTNK